MKRIENWTPPESNYIPEEFGESECDPRGALTLKQQIERMNAAGVLNRLNRERMFPNDGTEPEFDEPINIYADEFELRLQASNVLNLAMDAKAAHDKAVADAEAIRAKAEAEAAASAPPESPPAE